MEVIIIVVVGVLFVLSAVGILLFKRIEHDEEEMGKKVITLSFEPTMVMTPTDIAGLLGFEYLEELEMLMKESHVPDRLPVFYEKYQELNKRSKEAYFQYVLDLFVRGKEEWLEHLLVKGGDLSTQDILLILLIKKEFDNKSIAKVLRITPDTLKKRKSRLRAKMEQKGIVI